INIARLADMTVLTQEQAQKAIEIADAALKDLDRVRSGLGSVQNQLTSTIAGITATQLNLYSSESSIRDVDFSEEMYNLSKIKILQETGSFALNRASTRAENLLRLFTDQG
ncbi:MAG: flagellar protein FlaB, partial [Deltaproteobacteria bacterium]